MSVIPWCPQCGEPKQQAPFWTVRRSPLLAYCHECDVKRRKQWRESYKRVREFKLSMWDR